MVPLALAAAVSPTVLTVTILLLSSTDHPRLKTSAYLLGAAVAVIVIGIIALMISTAAGTKPAHPSAASALIDIALGVLLLAVGVRQFTKKPKPKKPEEAQEKKGQKSLGSQVFEEGALGVAMIASDYTSLVFYVAAAKQTTDAKLPAVEAIVPMAIVALGILAPIILPLGATLIAPGTSRRFLDAVNGLVKQDGRYIAGIVAFIFGIYLLYKGGRVLF